MSKSAQARRRSPDASIVTRRATINATSFDAKKNTFSAVISAGTPVKRRDPFDGSLYFEALAITPRSVRLDRVGVMPLLNSHRANLVNDMLGVVTAVRMEDGQLIADIRLSQSDDAKAVAAAIAAGTPPNVSIGYQVHAMTEGATRKGELPTHTVTDWELMEVSLVPIPADPKTHIRSQKGLNMDDEIVDDQNEYDIESETRGAPNGGRGMSGRDIHEAYDIASRANLPVNFARQHIERGVTLNRFRAIVFDRMSGDADRTRTGNIRNEGGDTFDNPEFLGRSIQDALYARMTGGQPSKAAASLMNESVLDFGRMLIRARGDRPATTGTGLVDQMMEQRGFVGGIGGHGRDDFPILLQGAGERVLRDAYQAVETPLKLLARRRLVRDFRTVSSLRLSEAPRLMKVNEGGELKYGSRSEAKEAGKIDTYGAIFALTRQALINDDLNAFGNSARDWGRSAAETEADLLVAMLTANGGDGPLLDDENPVYRLARGNKASAGAAISVGTLSTARQALRDMTGLDGKTPINAASKYLLVGSAKETEGEQILTQIAAAKVNDSNPFSGKLTLLVEPRLTGNAWRVFADPAQIASITIAYLSGEVGPRLDIQQGWTVLGTEFRCTLDFGCWMEDWRGTYLNQGN